MSLPNDIVPDRDEARRRQADDPLLGSAAAAADAAGLACPDAETLGLYAERALSRAEAATIEAHVKGCARCDEVLAAIALTLPGAAAVDDARAADGASGGVGGWLRGWRWMVPAMSLAGAAAVAFWLGRSPAPVVEVDLARTETGLARKAPDADAARDNFAAPAAPPAAAPMPEPPSAKVSAAPPSVGRLADAAIAGSGAMTAADAAEPVAAKRMAESVGARADAAPSERRMAARERPAESTVSGNLAADAAKPAAVQAESAQAMAAQAPARAAEAVPPPAAPAPAVTAAPQVAGTASASREERARALGATTSGAAGGTTPSGAGPADLRAPFERWRVRNGRLEFARDGRAWRRVTLPTTERVTRVTERPDASVLVVTASGAEFVSTNLGATWQRP